MVSCRLLALPDELLGHICYLATAPAGHLSTKTGRVKRYRSRHPGGSVGPLVQWTHLQVSGFGEPEPRVVELAQLAQLTPSLSPFPCQVLLCTCRRLHQLVLQQHAVVLDVAVARGAAWQNDLGALLLRGWLGVTPVMTPAFVEMARRPAPLQGAVVICSDAVQGEPDLEVKPWSLDALAFECVQPGRPMVRIAWDEGAAAFGVANVDQRELDKCRHVGRLVAGREGCKSVWLRYYYRGGVSRLPDWDGHATKLRAAAARFGGAT